MDKEKLIRQLMATFLEELDDHVRAMNRDLLVLEKHPADPHRVELLQSLFRSAHSLKGAARSVNVGVIEGACHRLEEILAAARDGRFEADAAFFSLLFAVLDAVEEAGMRLREQQDLTGAPLAALLPQLDAVISQIAASPPSGTPSVPTQWGPPRHPTGPADRPDRPSDPLEAAPLQRTSASASSNLDRQSATDHQSEAGPDGSSAAAVVRVRAEKLDALLAQSGELLVARRRVAARVEQLAALSELVERGKHGWETVRRPMRKWLEFAPRGPLEGRKLGSVAGPAEHYHAGSPPGSHARLAGALLETTESLHRIEQGLERLTLDLATDRRLLDQVSSSLDDEVRRVRMLPFGEACQGLKRAVRDLAKSAGKEVELVIQGAEVALDRSILEGLRDPLLHLVRNAVDHGIEPVANRRAAGKPECGRITVTAALRGGHVEVVVADDGNGLDLTALRQQARKRNLREPAEDRELAQLIFLPGFSTAQIITDVSGRGVGLDVVKNRLALLRGSVEVDSHLGAGLRFTLAVPLTLTTLRAVLFRIQDRLFAFASSDVAQLARVTPDAIRSVEGRPMLAIQQSLIPLASLAELLGIPDRESSRASGPWTVLVLARGPQSVAFVVDEIMWEQEVVVKHLGARIRRVRTASGATLLPSGRIALILNAPVLVRRAIEQAPSRDLAAAPAGAPAPAKKRLLVAEDSVTTRSLMKSILEAAGFEVRMAVDGESAWQLLQQHGADLVVSDVEMPRMDGFDFTQAIRNSKRFQELPVVLVTARETEQDKARGIEVGANAYLVKSAFDQRNLLQTIGQLL